MKRGNSRKAFLGAVFAVVFTLPAWADEATPNAVDDVGGRWLTESGNLEVMIAPCGAALCGTVAKVLANRSMSAPGAEMAAADARPALGMKILIDFRPVDDKEWKGDIYNRENGNTYSCRMTLLSPKQLEIRAYRLLPLFGKTQVWTRVSDTAGTNP